MARNLIHLVKLSHEDNTVVDNIGSTETDLVPNEEIESLHDDPELNEAQAIEENLVEKMDTLENVKQDNVDEVTKIAALAAANESLEYVCKRLGRNQHFIKTISYESNNLNLSIESKLKEFWLWIKDLIAKAIHWVASKLKKITTIFRDKLKDHEEFISKLKGFKFSKSELNIPVEEFLALGNVCSNSSDENFLSTPSNNESFMKQGLDSIRSYLYSILINYGHRAKYVSKLITGWDFYKLVNDPEKELTANELAGAQNRMTQIISRALPEYSKLDSFMGNKDLSEIVVAQMFSGSIVDNAEGKTGQNGYKVGTVKLFKLDPPENVKNFLKDEGLKFCKFGTYDKYVVNHQVDDYIKNNKNNITISRESAERYIAGIVKHGEDLLRSLKEVSESLDVINSFTNKEVEKHANEYNKSLHDQAMDIDPNLKKEAVNQAIATKSVLISTIAILNDALNIGTHWYFRVLQNRAHVLMSADGGDS